MQSQFQSSTGKVIFDVGTRLDLPDPNNPVWCLESGSLGGSYGNVRQVDKEKTNTFYNLDKYYNFFEQIHFASWHNPV